jgi:tetratricopeptide (TPR) repeat protein
VKTLTSILVLIFAGDLFGQAAVIDIGVTGEHTLALGDTGDSARQLAVADGRRKAWLAAAEQLQRRPDVLALGLTPAQLEAYTAAVVVPVASTPHGTGTSMQVPMQVRLDAAVVARLINLRKDQDTTRQLVAARGRMQQVHAQLADRTAERARATGDKAGAIVQQQQRMVTALDAMYLAVQASAALARTEESTIGGRAPSSEGRERARSLLETALALAPDSAEAHTGMGDLLVDASDPSGAETEFRKALASAPDSVPIRTKLAEAMRLQGKFTEAIAELRDAIRLDAGYAQAHADLGMILRAQRDFAGAVAEYQEAVRIDPDSIDAHNGFAVTLANQGRLDDAVAQFREIVRIDPDSALGYYNLAYALAELDRDEESAAALREVIRINPNHYNARYNLGELFRLEGKFDDSVRQFREYLRLAPDLPQNQRNIRRAQSFIEKYADQ